MASDYKDSVFLPKTSFSMKANLPSREPQIMQYWDDIKLYPRLREQSKGRPLFVLHDGPPYANGHLHVGHALNKTLKDTAIRSHQMMGYDAPFIPGWDCHGLPIEAKVEEKYRQQKRSKDEVDVIEFRKECRAYAEHWIEIQKQEFKRLGSIGRWDNPYTTMNYKAEAQIVRELGKFFFQGDLYLGTRPIMWSVVEKTALAEAEIEYHDRTSPSIYLGFPITQSTNQSWVGACMIIWTTTPWTIPGNRAIAYNPEVTYSLIETAAGRWIIATELVDAVLKACDQTLIKVLETFPGHALEHTICQHPLHTLGYSFAVPLLPGEHVTTDAGTGLVHTAPGHGLEDFALGKKFNIEVPYTVTDDGTYAEQVLGFAGTHIFKADQTVLPALRDSGFLFGESTITHSYPHSWRSKAPLIFRTTPQWFISMDKNKLREKALAALTTVKWQPANSINRIHSMIENRPDWCVSRQRTWGVPLTIFINKKTREPLKDPALFERIAKAFEAEGADIWFDNPEQRFLPPEHNPAEYEAVKDILDVWFDAGSTHAFVLEADPSVKWPASVYLEGSDQHRGWFQSSLMVSCGTRGKAPYEQIVTHGFLVDEHGRKMSKSLGNTNDLKDVVAQYGADILRLWVVSSDYTEDLRFGPNIIKQQEDIYRRFRNTFRYLLGSLCEYTKDQEVAYADLPPLEKWVMHRLHTLDALVRECYKSFSFHPLVAALHTFCASDLSAFYFDIRKDSLYCDASASLKRRATLTTLHYVFECLTKWLAPILCFTTEDVWQARYKDIHPNDSVHLTSFPEIPNSWQNLSLENDYDRLRDIRRVMTGALEGARAAGDIGSSLQASLDVYLTAELVAGFESFDWAEIAITSHVDLHIDQTPGSPAFSLDDVPGVQVIVKKADGEKCQRCWKVLPEVGTTYTDVCSRCHTVLNTEPVRMPHAH